MPSGRSELRSVRAVVRMLVISGREYWKHLVYGVCDGTFVGTDVGFILQ